MTLPTNWTSGEQLTAADENTLDTAVNANTTTVDALEAVSGIVKCNGSGSLSAAIAGTDYSSPAAPGTLQSPSLVTPALGTPASGVLTNCTTTTTPAATTLAEWDANKNLSANSFLQLTTSTATAAGTTTLTIASTQTQIFTGSTTQTVLLPTTSIAAGNKYTIVNQSSGAVTVQSSGANTVATLAGSTTGVFTATVATPTTAAGWFAEVKVAGKSLTVNNSLALAGTDGTTMTFPGTSDTVVTLGATQTLTAKTLTTPSISSPTFTGTGVPNAAIQQAGINNFNTAQQSQVVVSGTSYYITSSGLTMPATALNGMTANKTTFVWQVAMNKTAAGTGTFQIVIFRGTNGSIADTADVTQTLGTQSAAADSMNLTVQLTVTTTGATGAYYWSMAPTHEAATATGFGVATGASGQFSGTVSSVAMNTASLIFGLGFIATTGTPTIVIPTVQAFAFNMD